MVPLAFGSVHVFVVRAMPMDSGLGIDEAKRRNKMAEFYGYVKNKASDQS